MLDCKRPDRDKLDPELPAEQIQVNDSKGRFDAIRSTVLYTCTGVLRSLSVCQLLPSFLSEVRRRGTPGGDSGW